MRRMLITVAVLVATLLSPLATQAPFAQSTVAAVVPTSARARVIVKYRADSELMRKQAMTATGRRSLQVQALGDRIGIALTAGASITERLHVVFASGVDSKTLATRIAAESDIEYAVPDERKHIVAVPNDSFYTTRAYNNPTSPTSGGPLVGQWYLKPPGAAGTSANTAPSSINAEQAWDLAAGGSSIVIADIDTGLRFDHPDLQGGNILPGYDMVAADNTTTGADGTDFSTANDTNGRDSDASDPGDWISNSDLSNPDFANCTVGNSSWHGTQTAGLMGAATHNGAGIASVGQGIVKVMPVRVLGKCGGYDSDIIAGMLWAAGVSTPPGVQFAVPTPARVLNMSLGGVGACNSAYQDAVDQVVAKKVVIVVAAGNGDSTGTGAAVGTPANCNGVIAVTALRSAGAKVGFSDLGSEIAISAPGGNCINSTGPCLYPMITTANAGTTTPVAGAAGGIYTDSFNASLGTSFSAPLVSGTVALMLSVQPSLTPTLVKQYLQQTARPFPTTGGTVSIEVTTAAPAALSPVGLLAAQPPQCSIPTASNPNQAECLCTTSSCGAGMLDAHAAVTLASGGGLIPPTSVVTTNSYLWTLVDGGGIVSSLSGATTQNASATPTGAGTFSVSLTTTDSAGVASTTSSAVTVAAAPVAPPSSASGGGGGGGGAIGIGWLLMLLTAVLALAVEPSLQKRRESRISVPPQPSSRTR